MCVLNIVTYTKKILNPCQTNKLNENKTCLPPLIDTTAQDRLCFAKYLSNWFTLVCIQSRGKKLRAVRMLSNLAAKTGCKAVTVSLGIMSPIFKR